jgi:hypothetical protein
MVTSPIEPSGGMHIYTLRPGDHDERISLPLHVAVVAGGVPRR